jgi:hypothetical protein
MLHLLDRAKAMSGPVPHAQPGDAGQPPVPPESPAHIPDLAPVIEPAASPSPANGASTISDQADSRAEVRHKVLRKGKIVFANGAFEVECQVRDLNSTGAKLKLSGAVTVPSSFDITIYPEKVTRTVQVCWREDLFLGIKFIDD